MQDGERARIAVDRHTERLRHAVGSDVTVGRPDSAGGENIDVAMPERIECIDDRFLLIADHPHFLEIDADRGQTFRDIADVLWSWVRPDRTLLPITRSAAVTTSLEADELAVDMITCESAQNPGVRPSDQQRRRLKGAQGPGGMEENS